MPSDLKQALDRLADRDERFLQGLDQLEQTLERSQGAGAPAGDLAALMRALESRDAARLPPDPPDGDQAGRPGERSGASFGPPLDPQADEHPRQQERDRVQTDIRDLLREMNQHLRSLQADRTARFTQP